MTVTAKRCWLAAALVIGTLPAQTSRPAEDAFTERYCLACHNNAAVTAGLSLQGLDSQAPGDSPQIWERVLRKVASGEMPPSGMPAPDPSERAAFAGQLEQALDAAAAAAPNPGRPPPHRLNRAEYANAVRDLLDLGVDLGPLLPGDDSGYGFDNIADVLSLSPARMERYMIAARRASRLAVGHAGAEPVRDVYVRDRAVGFLRAGHAPARPGDLPPRSERGAAIKYYFPVDGEYSITASLDQGTSRASYEHSAARVALTAGLHTVSLTFPGASSRRETTSPGGNPEQPRAHPPLDIRIDGRRVRLVQLQDTAAPFQLRSIAIEGPFVAEGPGATPSRRKIFSCVPGDPAQELPCARKILARLARLAYRRPVDSADIDPLMAVFESGRHARGFEAGVERAIRALLVSPSFLFRIEPEQSGPGPHRLDNFAIASRLSFFLWSSIPDEALLAAAERGELADPRHLESQVRRMLADPKAQALVDNFAGQWLELRKLARIKPDNLLFPEFDSALREAMQRETELFVADVLRSNASILELLDSDQTFLNDRLAQHYGISGVRGAHFRRVSLDDKRRGGLLGQASVLAVTSYPNRTSVVIRGKWVLENLFGMPPPPPPPDIPELEEAAPSGKQLTLRELMTLHSQAPTCAGCHVRMDPIGFALENFDAIGRWRETQAGAPIDASGELPGGVRFDGPAELRQVLTTSLRAEFVRTVAEKLLTYALGRGLEYYDRPTVRTIVRASEEAGHGFADMVVSVVQSMPFRMRMGSQ